MNSSLEVDPGNTAVEIQHPGDRKSLKWDREESIVWTQSSFNSDLNSVWWFRKLFYVQHVDSQPVFKGTVIREVLRLWQWIDSITGEPQCATDSFSVIIHSSCTFVDQNGNGFSHISACLYERETAINILLWAQNDFCCNKFRQCAEIESFIFHGFIQECQSH